MPNTIKLMKMYRKTAEKASKNCRTIVERNKTGYCPRLAMVKNKKKILSAFLVFDFLVLHHAERLAMPEARDEHIV